MPTSFSRNAPAGSAPYAATHALSSASSAAQDVGEWCRIRP